MTAAIQHRNSSSRAVELSVEGRARRRSSGFAERQAEILQEDAEEHGQ